MASGTHLRLQFSFLVCSIQVCCFSGCVFFFLIWGCLCSLPQLSVLYPETKLQPLSSKPIVLPGARMENPIKTFQPRNSLINTHHQFRVWRAGTAADGTSSAPWARAWQCCRRDSALRCFPGSSSSHCGLWTWLFPCWPHFSTSHCFGALWWLNIRPYLSTRCLKLSLDTAF